MKVPTVRIRQKDAVVVINESDFDPESMALFAEPEAKAPEAKATTPKKRRTRKTTSSGA